MKIYLSFIFIGLTSCVHQKEKEIKEPKNELSQEEIIIMSEKSCASVADIELKRLNCQMSEVLSYCREHPKNKTRICYQAIASCLKTSKDISLCLPQ